VFAAPRPADILAGLRAGRVFAATGDLIDRLDFRLSSVRHPRRGAAMGDTLLLHPGDPLRVTIRLRPARKPNPGGHVPRLDHVDLILGSAIPGEDDHNPTTRLIRRFTARDWRREGDLLVVRYRLALQGRGYLRLRGTNTRQEEPAPDLAGEDPWQDLWFYANPIYYRTRAR